MDLPPDLRAALDDLLHDVAPSTLAPIAEAQSDTYRHRGDRGLDRLLVRSELDALAYAAWRLPATFGASASALAEVSRLAPDFRPRSHLDLGAGPGTALFAADAVFGTIRLGLGLEGSQAFRRAGRRIAAALGPRDGAPPEWVEADLARAGALEAALAGREDAHGGFDLVTLCYVTGELGATARARLVDDAWSRTKGCFVMVEPGTTAGHQRILAARTRLLGDGAHVVAPCSHRAPCPVAPPDWCHFAVRVPRSRVHRQVKGADLGYEDEKFAWLAVKREPVEPAPARLLRPSRVSKIAVDLDVCASDGTLRRIAIPRRSKPASKAAKKLRWGESVPEALLDAADVRDD